MVLINVAEFPTVFRGVFCFVDINTLGYHNKPMIHFPSSLARVFNVCVITVLLLASFSTASLANMPSMVCVQAGAESMQHDMDSEPSGVESASCCQTEETKSCCNACHIAVYQTARIIQLSLMELSDESAGVTSTRLSSLNPPPLIRPPVIV